jgi:hypothetical protein
MNLLTSAVPALAYIVLAMVFVSGFLIYFALRNKGDVFAELTHGKTTLRIDARDRRTTSNK